MYCEKCGNKIKDNEVYCEKCGTKVLMNNKKINIKVLMFLVICLIILLIIVMCNRGIEIPNLVGMTVAEAQHTMNELGIGKNLKISSEGNGNEIIQEQQGASGKVRKNDYFNVYVWTKEYYINEENEQQKRDKIENTIKTFASINRQYNGGSIKYSSYKKYKTSTNNENVYKIRYDTSIDNMYYYQLISLDDNDEKVVKKTRLFLFYGQDSTNETGEKLELEYAYEEIWK